MSKIRALIIAFWRHTTRKRHGEDSFHACLTNLWRVFDDCNEEEDDV